MFLWYGWCVWAMLRKTDVAKESGGETTEALAMVVERLADQDRAVHRICGVVLGPYLVVMQELLLVVHCGKSKNHQYTVPSCNVRTL